MSVTGKPLPPSKTLLGAIERGGRDAMSEAAGQVRPIVDSETPEDTRKLVEKLQPRVSRTKTGLALTVGAPRGARHDKSATIAEVIRYVTKGTGRFREGPGPKKPIRSHGHKALKLFGRAYWEVAGQHPNPFLERIRTRATPRVDAALRAGASAAARLAEGVAREG